MLQSCHFVFWFAFDRKADKKGESNSKDNTPSPTVLGRISDLSIRKVHAASLVVPKDVSIPQNDKHVFMVGVDGSENAMIAFNLAKTLAKPNTQIYVIHVESIVSDQSKLKREYQSVSVIEKYAKEIKLFQTQTNHKYIELVTLHAAVVSKELTKFAMQKKAHLLFVGADGMEQFHNKKVMFFIFIFYKTDH